MGISATDVRDLRDKTGAGMMDCKKALEEAGGDLKEAMVVLRKRGMAKAEKKKSTRTANDGLICHYLHPDGKLGVMIELNCETDFVARNDEFQELGKEICMQVAAMNPLALSRDEIPQERIDQEKSIYKEQIKDKPDNVVDKIIEGKLDKFFAENCLLDQGWIKDDSITIGELIDRAIGKIGEKITLKRFARMEIGESADE